MSERKKVEGTWPKSRPLDTAMLWNERMRSFWLRIAPYFRYVLGGGLGAFLILFFTIGGYVYARFLNTVTPDFPAPEAGAALLLPLIGWSSVRTFLREADRVFLVPAETRMGPYVKRAGVYSWAMSLWPWLLAWLVFWPVYQRATEAPFMTFLFLTAVLFGLKAVNLRGCWLEQQLRNTRARRMFVAVRWLMTAALLWTVLAYPVWAAVPLLVFAVLAYLAALGGAKRASLHWDRLIQTEQRHRMRIYLFLSWFVDVEELTRRVRRRAYLEWWSRRIPFRRDTAWLYLYFKTWLRSELFSVVVRVGVIGSVVVFFLSRDWMKIAALLGTLYVTGLQLSSLGHYHRHSFWFQIYPLPEGERGRSLKRLTFYVQLSLFALLLAAHVLTAGSWRRRRFRVSAACF